MENGKLPAVSIIIPTYNRAHLIDRSIKSVLAQTYRDFELIIVDDGSADNTEQVVRSYNDQRIRYLKHPKNRGVSAARNTGIKAAAGSYIAFQDSDDEWLPRKLEKQMALFEEDKKGDLGLVLCEYLVLEKERETHSAPNISNLDYEQLISHPGAFNEGPSRFLLKRDLTAAELYFDEKLRACEDWDFLLRISHICRIDYVKEVLVKYIIHNESHLGSRRNILEARNALLLKYADEYKTRPKALSYGYRQNAVDCHQLGQMRDMRRYLKASIKAYPWNPDLYLNFVIALFGRRGFQIFLTLRYSVFKVLSQVSQQRRGHIK
jgi:glycosyltransferase involved in cell wall biosynthesis